jgi:hypothetical protein
MSIYNVDKNVSIDPEDKKWYLELRKKYYPPEYVPHLRPFKKRNFKRK